MILIDKNNDLQTIILTLSENAEGLYGDYILKLTSDSNRAEYTFILPENTSAFTERYDLFTIETIAFSELSDGFYNYSVVIADKVIETGKAMVKSPVGEVDNVLQPNSSTNKILIYGE